MPLNPDDSIYLSRLLELSEGYPRRNASPNPAVSAIITNQDEIVGEGVHQGPGTPHAEVLAIQQAGPLAMGGTLYVSLEPCSHWGRTPPCIHAICDAQLARVVIGVSDPNPLVKATPPIPYLTSRGIDVVIGNRETDFRWVHRSFLKGILHQTPFVTAKVATSLDGKLAFRDPQRPYLTGPQSLEWVHHRRAYCDAIMVGIGTVLADDPLLTCRQAGAKNPIKLIVDSKGRLPLSARLFDQTTPEDVWVILSNDAQGESVEALSKVAQFIRFTPPFNWQQVLGDLAKRGIHDLIIEGGPTLLTSAFSQGAIDAIDLMVAPTLLGGANRPTFLEGEELPLGGIDSQIRSVIQRGGDVHITSVIHPFFKKEASI